MHAKVNTAITISSNSNRWFQCLVFAIIVTIVAQPFFMANVVDNDNSRQEANENSKTDTKEIAEVSLQEAIVNIASHHLTTSLYFIFEFDFPIQQERVISIYENISSRQEYVNILFRLIISPNAP